MEDMIRMLGANSHVDNKGLGCIGKNSRSIRLHRV